MTSNDIRKRFLDFFGARGHRVLPSSSLVPAHDPTLLFSNAGMNQFKDAFLGREKRDYSRAATSQKCVRAGGKHNDLEQVGRTTRHHTFFEMLGNFSFGDYFKKEAIPWAWELVTKDYAIPAEKLYVTVFREDDEAAEIWAKDVGVARERIFRMDEQDNFWAMGDTGPCGPCSEIHYDLSPAASTLGHSDCPFPCAQDCGRYVELWNLVFMQFNRDEQGNMTPLPRPSIDTGAGLERLATVLQGKISNYDTDLFRPLIEEAAELANAEYGANHDTDVSLRIIADHARAATFLISDGVLPSNEGRGYVLRKIMRRALIHGRNLGLNEPFLYKMAGHVAQMMKDSYPELLESEQRTAKTVKNEEIGFARTVSVGLAELYKLMPRAALRAVAFLQQSGEGVPPNAALSALRIEAVLKAVPSAQDGLIAHETKVLSESLKVGSRRAVTLPGAEAFKLYDTYGLPRDLIEDVTRDAGVDVDWPGFERAMEEQRARARANWKATEKAIAEDVYSKAAEKYKVAFLGYETTRAANCRVLELIQRETKYPPGQGIQWEVILDRTPFYAEAGGQVGDTGWLRRGGQRVAIVEDTYSPISGLIMHKVRWLGDKPVDPEDIVGSLVEAEVDAERRDATRRNHTATHLLHAALRKTLGTHVKQAGSLVAPDRLRFDFTHYAALDEQDLLDIEDLVNEHILKNEVVATEERDLDSAVAGGAMALFGEKYADKVRVLSIDDFSKELCGGTHVRRTGDIGLFKIVSESGVAAGTRRIEAVTGEGVLKYLRQASETLALLADSLHAKPEELLQAVEKLSDSEKKLRKALEAQRQKGAEASLDEVVSRAGKVKGVFVIAQKIPEPIDRAALRNLADRCRAQIKSGVVVLGNVVDDRVSLVAAVTKDLTNKLDAGKIVKQAAAIVEGSGGGRKDLAEAGGKNPAKLDESLQAVPSIVEAMLP